MSRAAVLHFHLPETKRRQAALGEGIFGLIVQAVQRSGWQVQMRAQNDPVDGDGYHIVYNTAVPQPHCLSLRRCYMNPFWRLEKSNDRWNWDVAAKTFPGGPGEDWFSNRWRSRIFGERKVHFGGHIFMPLQGKLMHCRHFQSQSPMDMIATTLAADPTRQIIATLHPRETYNPLELEMLAGSGARFTLSDKPSIDLLASCAYVVTQNSAMALSGFFIKKPAVLFAEIDFHHIAGSVPHLGVAKAFASVHQPKAYAAYLHWFFKAQAISAIDENAIPHIQARLREHGWPM